MTLPTQVKLVEVGPRDGLQNEPTLIPTPIKIEFIDRLSRTGLSVIETTSFVSSEKIPQLADAHDVLKGIYQDPSIQYPVLVPNMTGFDAACEAGARHIAIFAACTETFSQKNIHCTIDESLQHYEAITAKAKKHNILVRGYLSCVLGCPYEGRVEPQHVQALAQALFDMGCYEISLGDTIGIGTPDKVEHLFETVTQAIPIEHLAAHFHDTYGQALANLYAALQLGITTIDSAVAGLGGCPYAKGATGNVASEDVLYLLNGLGIETGVDLTRLIEAGQMICDHLNKPNRSKVALALQNAT